MGLLGPSEALQQQQTSWRARGGGRWREVQGSADHTHSQTENSWTGCARGWKDRPLTWSTRSTWGVGRLGGRHSGPLLSLLKPGRAGAFPRPPLSA